MSYRDERRQDKVAETTSRAQAEAIRLKAEAEAEAVRSAAMAEANRQAERERRATERQAERDRQAAKERRQQRRQAARARLRERASRHVVELLIYPIALVSFVLAAPAMADYGREVYVSLLGVGLPLITELGMWAFAVAVQVTRHRHPERPVWALQLGVWTFSAVAFGLNLLHGLTADWSHGVVMGVVAVSGVVAHQLTVASPPRSRAERAEARIARQAERKVARVRKAAVRQATAEIDADGRARLVYRTGRYALDGRRLVEAIEDPDTPGPVDELDRELAALLDAETGRATRPDQGSDDGGEGTGVAVLDPPRPDGPDSKKPGKTSRARGGRERRSLDDLRAELDALIAADPRAVDVESASAIARALGCDKRKARQLRDEYSRRS